MNAPRHVFEIDWSVWTALSVEEITATVEAMTELELYKLPYDEGEIVVRLYNQMAQNVLVLQGSLLRDGEDFSEDWFLYPKIPCKGLDWYKRHLKDNPVEWTASQGAVLDMGVVIENKKIVHKFKPAFFDLRKLQKHYRDGLIVLLASKGLEKRTREPKLAKLGIGKKRNNEYITTIRLSQQLEADSSVKTGRPVKPHLRRGHIRSQHHGPQNSLVKRIWIDPVFVNADAEYVGTRTAYRVRH